MNPNVPSTASPIQLTVASSALSTDGTAVVITYNPPPPVSFSIVQLTQQLAQAQAQLANGQNLVTTATANIAAIQANIALFTQQATPPTT